MRLADRVGRVSCARARRSCAPRRELLGSGSSERASARGCSRLASSLCSARARSVRDVDGLLHRGRAGALYTPEFRARLARTDCAERDQATPGSARDARDRVNRLLDVDVQTYLPGDLLVKMDIASMAHSLEVRSPLLDHEFMELCAGFPGSWKLSGGTTKKLFKDALRPWLPDHLLDRPKWGFGVPIAAWFRGPLRDLPREILLDEATARARALPRAVRARSDRPASCRYAGQFEPDLGPHPAGAVVADVRGLPHGPPAGPGVRARRMSAWPPWACPRDGERLDGRRRARGAHAAIRFAKRRGIPALHGERLLRGVRRAVAPLPPDAARLVLRNDDLRGARAPVPRRAFVGGAGGSSSAGVRLWRRPLHRGSARARRVRHVGRPERGGRCQSGELPAVRSAPDRAGRHPRAPLPCRARSTSSSASASSSTRRIPRRRSSRSPSRSGRAAGWSSTTTRTACSGCSARAPLFRAYMKRLPPERGLRASETARRRSCCRCTVARAGSGTLVRRVSPVQAYYDKLPLD